MKYIPISEIPERMIPLSEWVMANSKLGAPVFQYLDSPKTRRALAYHPYSGEKGYFLDSRLQQAALVDMNQVVPNVDRILIEVEDVGKAILAGYLDLGDTLTL